MKLAARWRDAPLDDRIEIAAAALCFAFFALLPFNGVLALKRLLLALILALAARQWWHERTTPNIPWPVWVWFLLAPLSALWSVSPRFTLSESVPDALYPALAMLGLCILASGSRFVLRYAIFGMIVGTVVVATIGSMGVLKAGGITNYLWYELAHGYGQLSTLLVAILPFLLVAIIQAASERQPVSMFAAITALLSLLWMAYATQARMFWLAAILVMAIVAAGTLTRSEFAAYRRQAILAFVAIISVLVVGFIVAARAKVANYLEVPMGTGTGGSGHSIIDAFMRNERYEMWRFWLQRIAERPFLGIGFGHDLPRDTFQSMRPEHWLTLMFAHAHNVLLDTAIGLGLFGLGTFLVAIAAICCRLARSLKAASLPDALAGVAGIALVVGVLSKNLTDDFMSRNPLFAFWALIGLALGASITRRRKGWSL